MSQVAIAAVHAAASTGSWHAGNGPIIVSIVGAILLVGFGRSGHGGRGHGGRGHGGGRRRGGGRR
jgi:hypothetical protein